MKNLVLIFFVFFAISATAFAYDEDFLVNETCRLLLNKQYDQAENNLDSYKNSQGIGLQAQEMLRYISFYKAMNEMYDNFMHLASDPNNYELAYKLYNNDWQTLLWQQPDKNNSLIVYNKSLIDDFNSKQRNAATTANGLRKAIEEKSELAREKKYKEELDAKKQYEITVEAARLRALEQEKKANEARQAEANVRRAILQEKAANLELCEATKAFKLFLSQESIIEDFSPIAEAREGIKNENAIERETGVRNIAVDYDNGSKIVELKKDIRENWSIYKKLGGKASGPTKVKHSIKDPCKDLVFDRAAEIAPPPPSASER